MTCEQHKFTPIHTVEFSFLAVVLSLVQISLDEQLLGKTMSLGTMLWLVLSAKISNIRFATSFDTDNLIFGVVMPHSAVFA